MNYLFNRRYCTGHISYTGLYSLVPPRQGKTGEINIAVKGTTGPQTSEIQTPFEEENKVFLRNGAEFCVPLEGGFFFFE